MGEKTGNPPQFVGSWMSWHDACCLAQCVRSGARSQKTVWPSSAERSLRTVVGASTETDAWERRSMCDENAVAQRRRRRRRGRKKICRC